MLATKKGRILISYTHSLPTHTSNNTRDTFSNDEVFCFYHKKSLKDWNGGRVLKTPIDYPKFFKTKPSFREKNLTQECYCLCSCTDPKLFKAGCDNTTKSEELKAVFSKLHLEQQSGYGDIRLNRKTYFKMKGDRLRVCVIKPLRR